MVVGNNIEFLKVPNFTIKTLAGWFHGKNVHEEDFSCLLEHQWLPLLDYQPTFHILIIGWIVFIFRYVKDCEAVLAKSWC
jgi:hypothetical protein